MDQGGRRGAIFAMTHSILTEPASWCGDLDPVEPGQGLRCGSNHSILSDFSTPSYQIQLEPRGGPRHVGGAVEIPALMLPAALAHAAVVRVRD
jgi:hypothetical protein